MGDVPRSEREDMVSESLNLREAPILLGEAQLLPRVVDGDLRAVPRRDVEHPKLRIVADDDCGPGLPDPAAPDLPESDRVARRPPHPGATLAVPGR